MGPTHTTHRAFSWDPTIPTIPLHCVVVLSIGVAAAVDVSSLDKEVPVAAAKARNAIAIAPTAP